MNAPTPKQALRRLVDNLDDDATFEEVQHKMYVVQKIQQGLRDVEEGRTYTSAEVRQHVNETLRETREDG